MADEQERAAAAADADMADASSEDGSSSDSDFEEIELSPEDAKLLMKLEQQLAANPNLYDSHVQVRLCCLAPPPTNCTYCSLQCLCCVCLELHPSLQPEPSTQSLACMLLPTVPLRSTLRRCGGARWALG